MITKEQINRINELARKARESELSQAEKEEQAKLRRIYIDSFKESLVGQLENTYIVDEHGNKKKVQRAKRESEKADKSADKMSNNALIEQVAKRCGISREDAKKMLGL